MSFGKIVNRVFGILVQLIILLAMDTAIGNTVLNLITMPSWIAILCGVLLAAVCIWLSLWGIRIIYKTVKGFTQTTTQSQSSTESK